MMVVAGGSGRSALVETKKREVEKKGTKKPTKAPRKKEKKIESWMHQCDVAQKSLGRGPDNSLEAVKELSGPLPALFCTHRRMCKDT
jgi:hypothetical protein